MVYVRIHIKAWDTRSSSIYQGTAKIFKFYVQENIPNTPFLRRCKDKFSNEYVREASWKEFVKKEL